MNQRFFFGGDATARDHFDQCEDDAAAVQGGDGQHVENSQVDAEKRRQTEQITPALSSDFGGDAANGHQPAHTRI